MHDAEAEKEGRSEFERLGATEEWKQQRRQSQDQGDPRQIGACRLWVQIHKLAELTIQYALTDANVPNVMRLS